MTIGDNRDYIGVLLYSYYTTITGWGVLLRKSGLCRHSVCAKACSERAGAGGGPWGAWGYVKSHGSMISGVSVAAPC